MGTSSSACPQTLLRMSALSISSAGISNSYLSLTLYLHYNVFVLKTTGALALEPLHAAVIVCSKHIQGHLDTHCCVYLL